MLDFPDLGVQVSDMNEIKIDISETEIGHLLSFRYLPRRNLVVSGASGTLFVADGQKKRKKPNQIHSAQRQE